jgi:hypothetical protein
MTETSKQAFLTFDVEGPPGREDFANALSIKALCKLLKTLNERHLKGLFFFPSTVDTIYKNRLVHELLDKHDVGFHSSSHSVRPRIIECTDLGDYDDAVQASLIRETSQIDPVSGRIVGSGGIYSLREAFPNKTINAFRAPFNYFSPPNVESLRKLSIEFVFSGDFCSEPFSYKGLTFYPSSKSLESFMKRARTLYYAFGMMSNRKNIVFDAHPAHFIYKIDEDQLKRYFRNPMTPFQLELKSSLLSVFNLSGFESSLASLSALQKLKLIEVDPRLQHAKAQFNPKAKNFEKTILFSQSIATDFFGYKPRFLRNQYLQFFECSK